MDEGISECITEGKDKAQKREKEGNQTAVDVGVKTTVETERSADICSGKLKLIEVMV